jgi:hypothetical protein
MFILCRLGIGKYVEVSEVASDDRLRKSRIWVAATTMSPICCVS